MKLSNRNWNILLILAFLVVVSKSKAQSGYELKFSILGASGVKARIGHFYGHDLLFQDSSHFNELGEVVFKGVRALPEGLYVLQFENRSLDFIVGSQKFSVIASLQNLDSTAISANSKENDIYFHYKKMLLQKRQEMNRLKKEIAQTGSLLASKRLEAIPAEVNQHRKDLFSKYPHNLAVKIIQAGIESKQQKQVGKSTSTVQRMKLFETLDMEDPRMVRTPYIEDKIIRYFKETTIHPDSLAKSCDELLSMPSHGQVSSFMLSYMLDFFEKTNKPWMDVVYCYLVKKHVLKDSSSLDPLKLSVVKANLKRMEPLLTGKVAPPINFVDSLFRPIPLYSLKAKYTIVYFWDPDCSHCQEVTPQLWDFYKQVHHLGIEVYAVSVQQVVYSWKEYIQQHGLTWINVWEPTQIAEIYKTYQVGSTPAIYLLDEQKRILCKKIDLKELKNYISMLQP